MSSRKKGWFVPFRPVPTGNTSLRSTIITLLTSTGFIRRISSSIVVLFCKVKDARKSEITRHFKRIHPTHETPALIGKLTNNIKFIDPGTFKKPRKRIHREERERAQQLRRQNLPSQPLFELSDNYNPRDQRYPKGGFLHKWTVKFIICLKIVFCYILCTKIIIFVFKEGGM